MGGEALWKRRYVKGTLFGRDAMWKGRSVEGTLCGRDVSKSLISEYAHAIFLIKQCLTILLYVYVGVCLTSFYLFVSVCFCRFKYCISCFK